MKKASKLPVILSDLSSTSRNVLTDRYGVVWNTSDNFDSDVAAYRPIMRYHRMIAFGNKKGHWYAPDAGESMRYQTFETERAAFNALAGKMES